MIDNLSEVAIAFATPAAPPTQYWLILPEMFTAFILCFTLAGIAVGYLIGKRSGPDGGGSSLPFGRAAEKPDGNLQEEPTGSEASDR